MGSTSATPAMPGPVGRAVVLRPPVPPAPPVRLARRAFVRLLLPVGVLVLLGGLGAVAMMLSGEPLVICMGLVITALLLLACVALVSLLRSNHGRIEVVQVHGRLELPPTATARWIWPIAAGLVLAMAGILVAGGAAGVDLGSTRFTSPGVGVVLAVLVLGGVLANPPSPSAVPRIVLTSDGVGRRRRQRTRLMGWDEIAPPRLVTDPGVQVVVWRRNVRGAPLSSAGGLDELRLILPLALYGSDPRLVLALVEHYRANPGDRAELAGPEVIERLRRGDLDTIR